MTKLPYNQILHGDCLEQLAKLPAESIDMVFADPPYNLQLRQELRRPDNSRVEGVTDRWDKFDTFEDYDVFTANWLMACRRVLKKTGTLWVIGTYHNIYRVGKILQDLEFWILNDITWIKSNPTPNFRGVRFTNAHETLLWAQKQKGASYTFNHHAMKNANDGKQMRSDWEIPVCSGKERVRIAGEKAHSTQKPEALLYRVLQSSTNPGDTILDPFFGTGTTGAVAKKLHRNWIGVEKEKKYVKVAQRRIDRVMPNQFEQEVFVTHDPKKEQKIPFGHLLEAGLINPGDVLYFENNPKEKARVLADGNLKLNGFKGSIHQVAGEKIGSPANGWEYWYYVDERGDRKPIDDLRKQLRSESKAINRTA